MGDRKRFGLAPQREERPLSIVRLGESFLPSPSYWGKNRAGWDKQESASAPLRPPITRAKRKKPLQSKASTQPRRAEQDDLGRTCLLHFLEVPFCKVLMGVYRKRKLFEQIGQLES